MTDSPDIPELSVLHGRTWFMVQGFLITGREREALDRYLENPTDPVVGDHDLVLGILRQAQKQALLVRPS